MNVKIEGNELVIRIPMDDTPSPSSTGKSLTVASTRGNKPTDVKVQGKNLVVSVNAYIPVK